ncbi:MAG: hypothetical protein WC284_03520 [Candidimonas sp.]
MPATQKRRLPEQAKNEDPALTQPGILFMMSDVVEGTQDEFNRWYQREQLPAKLSLGGFTGARRYHAVGGDRAYMTMYECSCIDVLSSERVSRHMAEPTPWKLKVRPTFRNLQLAACRETWSAGQGIGGAAILVQCKALHGRADDARQFIAQQLTPRLLAADGTVRIALWEADEEATTAYSAQTDPNDLANYAQWVLFVESYDLVKTALLLHTELLAHDSARTGLLVGSFMRYRLISILHPPVAPAGA